jgi:hypothetical protein
MSGPVAPRVNFLELFMRKTGLSRETVRELLDKGWWYDERTDVWVRDH